LNDGEDAMRAGTFFLERWICEHAKFGAQ